MSPATPRINLCLATCIYDLVPSVSPHSSWQVNRTPRLLVQLPLHHNGSAQLLQYCCRCTRPPVRLISAHAPFSPSLMKSNSFAWVRNSKTKKHLKTGWPNSHNHPSKPAREKKGCIHTRAKLKNDWSTTKISSVNTGEDSKSFLSVFASLVFKLHLAEKVSSGYDLEVSSCPHPISVSLSLARQKSENRFYTERVTENQDFVLTVWHTRNPLLHFSVIIWNCLALTHKFTSVHVNWWPVHPCGLDVNSAAHYSH